MRARPPAHLRLLLGGLAALGVVAAHVIAYLLAEPDPHARTEMLAATGHGNWTFVVALALGATVAGLVRYAYGRAVTPALPAPTTGSLFVVAAIRLIPLQVLGCVGLEALERLASGGAAAAVVTEPAVLIGIGLQLVFALVGAVVLVVFARAVDLILRRPLLPDPSAPPICAPPISRLFPPRFQVAAGYGTLRGPPTP
jgi:hypothetical protein